jgi:protein-disulfide isomerase
MTDGRSERILCNAYYSGGASQLSMAIRCKSDTQSIDMRSKLAESGGKLTGNWEERTYNAEGAATGTVTPTKMTLAISGAVNGSMVVDVTKTRHTVTIATTGTALKSVSVTLNRS